LPAEAAIDIVLWAVIFANHSYYEYSIIVLVATTPFLELLKISRIGCLDWRTDPLEPFFK